MSTRELYRILRRMERIGERLESIAALSPGIGLCWLTWWGRYGEAFDALPPWVQGLLGVGFSAEDVMESLRGAPLEMRDE